MACCAVPPTGIGVVEVPHEDEGLRPWGCSYLPIEGLVRLVLLVGWPVADPDYNVTSPCPAFNPDPQALSQFLIHPQAELHALQLVIDTEDNIPSLPRLPVLPKEPVSFHSNTLIIGAIPAGLHDTNEITALQARL